MQYLKIPLEKAQSYQIKLSCNLVNMQNPCQMLMQQAQQQKIHYDKTFNLNNI